ncbi:MAG: N-formylglutamate amidohydrolase [Myxococcota bacterium]|nr:N-formylglutamate amidohydrolase [Myxococcota bacterium]
MSNSTTNIPDDIKPRIVVDTVHDGNFIPPELMRTSRITRLQEDKSLWEHYVIERDWGANLVAEKLVSFLGLEHYYRVNLARVVMDFNRFPGSSTSGANSLERLAINPPFSDMLSHEEKYRVLRTYYDEISKQMESVIANSLIKISIHTYDEHNVSRTQRPEVSLISRSLSYQRFSKLPFGKFDPLFPDILAESTTTRILRDRIALHLEKAGVLVEHNYPYCLPDGSLEIRALVWFFFQHLRDVFAEHHPETKEDSSYGLVWHMLLNTNLREAQAEALYGYLHRFRTPPENDGEFFAEARDAYEHIREFLDQNYYLVENFRTSPERPSAISVEVRKDLIWEIEDLTPVRMIEERATLIAEKIAEAVSTYLREDLKDSAHSL